MGSWEGRGESSKASCLVRRGGECLLRHTVGHDPGSGSLRRGASLCYDGRLDNGAPRSGGAYGTGQHSTDRDLPAPLSANDMKAKTPVVSDLRAEYDFSKGVRGKYAKRLTNEGSNVVVLEPDVAKAFPTSAAVNEALRLVLKAGQSARRPTTRSSGHAAKAAVRRSA